MKDITQEDEAANHWHQYEIGYAFILFPIVCPERLLYKLHAIIKDVV